VDLSAQTFLKGYDRNRLRRGSPSISGDGPLLFREASHTIKDYFVYDTKGSLYPNIPFVVSGAVARRQTRAHDSDVRHRNWRRHNCGQSSLNPCWGLPRCVFAVRPRRTNDRQMMALGAAGGGKGIRPVLGRQLVRVEVRRWQVSGQGRSDKEIEGEFASRHKQ
jgi:hypothetical protein